VFIRPIKFEAAFASRGLTGSTPVTAVFVVGEGVVGGGPGVHEAPCKNISMSTTKKSRDAFLVVGVVGSNDFMANLR
jgi:hypothetical protein